MLIGAMNHPRHDVIEEIRWMADMGLDFVDLTLEPPAAGSWQVDPRAVRAALKRTGLGVVAHTAFYLPLSSPFERIRRAAVDEMIVCAEIFAAVGARWMNLHPDRPSPMQTRPDCIAANLKSIRELLKTAGRLGVGLMAENLPGHFNTPGQLGELLEPLPSLGLHLDIGHANLDVPRNTAPSILRAWGKRLRHVHLHDNRGGHADLHLALGAGTLELAKYVRALRATGYDDTITLEVFSPDHHYLAYSVARLREVWERVG